MTKRLNPRDTLRAAKVVDIGEFRISRWQETKYGEQVCRHANTTIVSDGQYVVCDDCEAPLSAYWVLNSLLDSYARSRESLAAGIDALREAREKDIAMLAAQQIESLWRGGSMAPTCPHCHAAILVTDGMGSRSVNTAIELRRREVKNP